MKKLPLFYLLILFTSGCSLSGRTPLDDRPVGQSWKMILQWGLRENPPQPLENISLKLNYNGTVDSNFNPTWLAIRAHGKYEIDRENKTISLPLLEDNYFIIFQYNVQSDHLTLSYIGLLDKEDSYLNPYGPPIGFVMQADYK
jgi:hypothetical protein